ncbi:MAG TPA: response regulator [Kofleriaceae bacterium]|nr:response regulator [Kofleriaceae bacterium]
MDGEDRDGQSDRRHDPREPITLAVEYDSAEELLGDVTENLSASGLCVTTHGELAGGEPVDLVLSFPGLIAPIAIAGVVRWVRPDDDGIHQAGIALADPEGEAATQLEAILDRVRRRDPDTVGRVLKLLVVEDNPHVADLIRDGLRGWQLRDSGDLPVFTFRTAHDGRQALDMLAAESFDALILDIYLPVLDGVTVIERIRAQKGLRALPIIAVSAGGASVRENALRAGADFFLDKPMRLRQIIDTMRRLVSI